MEKQHNESRQNIATHEVLNSLRDVVSEESHENASRFTSFNLDIKENFAGDSLTDLKEIRISSFSVDSKTTSHDLFIVPIGNGKQSK